MQIISHGIDAVAINRIQRMLDDHGQRFVERCFTPGERAYADAAQKSRAERYAARFACKEAVLKALGTGWRSGITWCDIEVTRDPMGKPSICLSGRCADLARTLSISRWHLSLTHTSDLAIASVIACGGGEQSDN